MKQTIKKWFEYKFYLSLDKSKANLNMFLECTLLFMALYGLLLYIGKSKF